MESDGPYKVEQFGARNRNEFVVVGPGWEKVCEIYTRSGAEKAALYSNISYAEGRKAAEEDLKELLEFSDRMSKWARDLSGKELVYRFQHWKRSHGFVDENSEKEMRELWHILHD